MRWSNVVCVAAAAAITLAAAGAAGAASFAVSGASLSFGSYDPDQSGETRTTTTITLTCTSACPPQVAVVLREGGDGSAGHRRGMRSASGRDVLEYALSLSAGGGAVDQLVAPVAQGVPISFRVEMSIPGRQNVEAGAYGDRVRVSLEW